MPKRKWHIALQKFAQLPKKHFEFFFVGLGSELAVTQTDCFQLGTQLKSLTHGVCSCVNQVRRRRISKHKMANIQIWPSTFFYILIFYGWQDGARDEVGILLKSLPHWLHDGVNQFIRRWVLSQKLANVSNFMLFGLYSAQQYCFKLFDEHYPYSFSCSFWQQCSYLNLREKNFTPKNSKGYPLPFLEVDLPKLSDRTENWWHDEVLGEEHDAGEKMAHCTSTFCTIAKTPVQNKVCPIGL